jgi:thiol-disulfide isomerase/thioredoxin
MAKARIGPGVIAGFLLLWGAAEMRAAPTVAQMLAYRPKQEGVVVSTPAPEKLDQCKVELVKAGSISAWVVKDGDGQIIRRYYDATGTNKPVNVWSYYLKGVEVYREIDTNYNGKVDQYRWLNAGGTRWGLDPTEDGKIKSWKAISPEEVSQEVLAALGRHDLARFQALLLTEGELKSLDLPATEAGRIRDQLSKAAAHFQSATDRLPGVTEKTRWDHLELPAPRCLPAEGVGHQDVIAYPSGQLAYQAGDKLEYLQLGDIIQVAGAYRLIDAPAPSQADGPDQSLPKDLQVLLEELGKVDAAGMAANTVPADIYKYNMKRAEVLEKMVGVADKSGPGIVKPEEREQWVRQIADCYGAAAQNCPAGDKSAIQKLTALKDQVVKAQAGGNLAGYIIYCEMAAQYAADLVNADLNPTKVQKEWLEKWAKFVQDYPKAENTADALLQLGMVSELMGDEASAKKWYDAFGQNFPSNPQAAKVKGASRRLSLDGKEMELAGMPLSGGSAWDIKSAKGKVVAVYYWASWNSQCAADFARLKALQTTYGSKGFDVVCVNLDNTAAEATAFLTRNPGPSLQLFEPGGMSSRLSDQYGIMVLPSLFLIDKDGKVVSRTVQVSTLEEEIKKLVK